MEGVWESFDGGRNYTLEIVVIVLVNDVMALRVKENVWLKLDSSRHFVCNNDFTDLEHFFVNL